MQNQIVRDGYFFLGDHPALDFLNTKPLQKGQALELLKDFSALLRWLVAVRLLEEADAGSFASRWANSPSADAALESVLSFRENLRSAILSLESNGEIPGPAVDELNGLLSQHPVSFQVVPEGRTIAKEIKFSLTTPEDLLGIIANAAADLFSGSDLTRIRKCESCVIHFHDATKNRTRRWCSMQLCGNRAKVSAYAARKRRAR